VLPPYPSHRPQALDLYHLHPLVGDELAGLHGLTGLQELSAAALEVAPAQLPPGLTLLEVKQLEQVLRWVAGLVLLQVLVLQALVLQVLVLQVLVLQARHVMQCHLLRAAHAHHTATPSTGALDMSHT
jgi:hypothetical protein